MSWNSNADLLFTVRTYSGYRLLLETATEVLLQCLQRTRCLSQRFGIYTVESKVETTAETCLPFSTLADPDGTPGYVSFAAAPPEEVVLAAVDLSPGAANPGVIGGSL